MASSVISMRLPAESATRLKRMARRHGWTPSDTSARLVEEGLRRSEFAYIDFRDSIVGRQAYMEQSGLAVWEVMMLVRGYKGSIEAVAKHLRWPLEKVQAAANYTEAYTDEIKDAIDENDAIDFASMKQVLPKIRQLVIKN